MPLPSKIKIGAMTYSVVEVQDLPDYGLCDEEKATILLKAGMPEDVALITLWHEVMHAALYALGYRRHNERMVDGLAYQIVLILKDNKELVNAFLHGQGPARDGTPAE